MTIINTNVLNQNLKESDNSGHITLSLQDIDINRADEAFHLYIIEHSKKQDYYFINCSFQLVFNDYEYCAYITSNLSDDKTMFSWQKIFRKCD